MLVVPFFIDWSDHRATFEREASALIGHKVTVKGEADAQFLPIPTFTFTDVEVGEQGKQPLMSAGRIKVRVELLALLSREINVIDMDLDAPQVSLRMEADGATNWSLKDRNTAIEDGYKVKLGPVSIRDGSIYAVDQKTSRSLSVEAIDATVTAQALIGPWKVEGKASQQNEPFDFKIATGKFADDKIRIKTSLISKKFGLDAIFDGEVALARDETVAKGPSYAGKLSVRPSRKPKKAGEIVEEPPTSRFALTGQFELDRAKFLLSQALFEDGAREAPLSLNGSLRVPLDGDVRFQAVVSSRQIDLDRAYGKGVEGPVSLQVASSVMTNIVQALPKPPIPGTISFDVPGVVVGGDVVRGVHFDATPVANGWKVQDFGAILPGTTRVFFNGLVEIKKALLLDGDLKISSERPISLARWWRPASGDDARRIRVRDFRLSSKISAEENAVRLSDMNVEIGSSDLQGRLAYSRISDRQSSFDANLNAKRLNVDAIQALAALFVGESNVSGFRKEDVVTIKLQADTMVAQALEGRSALIDLKVSGGEIDIGSLKIADFAGAKIDVAGSVKNIDRNPTGRLSGSVRAEETTGLIKLGDALFPTHPWLAHLKRHGKAFVPLNVNVNFSGDQKNGEQSSDFAATITGKLGAGDVKAGMRFVGDWQKAHQGDIELSFVSTYEDGSAFLRQAGWPLLDIGATRTAEVDFTARGSGSTGIALKSKMMLEGVEANASGVVFINEENASRYNMDTTVQSEDVEPLLQLLGFSLPASGLGRSLDLTATVAGEGYNGRLEALKGTLQDQELSGSLRFEGQSLAVDKPWRWQGELETQQLSLSWLSALATGEIITPADFTISPDSVGEAHRATELGDDNETGSTLNNWSQGQFNQPYLENLSADIKVSAQTLNVSDVLEIANSAFELRLRDDSLALTKLSGLYGGGRVGGSLRLENNDGAVTASGLFELMDVNAEDLFWKDDQRPLVEGNVSASFQFEGTGRSVEGMVNTLGGGGSLRLANGRVRRINPLAFGLILEAADKENVTLDDGTIRPLIENYLDAGVLDVSDAEASFTMTSGVARVANTSFNNKDMRSTMTASFDLPELTMKGTMALSVDPVRVDKTPVSGSTPEIAVLFQGPIKEPSRKLDLQPLLSYLTVRRFEQEVRRVEILQADILEKQRLSRYARWVAAEVVRERRVFEEEQRRLEAEERERLEAIEARKKREQAAKQKARERAEVAARRAAERKARVNQPINIEEELRRLEQGIFEEQSGGSNPIDLRPNIGN